MQETSRWLIKAGLALSVWCLATAGVAQTGKPVLVGDAAIVAAKAAYEARDLAAFDRLNPTGHVLASYVDYWWLRVALDKMPPRQLEANVQTFLKQAADTPLAPQLQRAWLKALGKTQDWVSFAIDYPPPEEDTELACYGIQYRYQRDGDGALAAGKALWPTGKTLPESCRPVFDAMRAKGLLTDEDIRARYLLAVQAANASLAKAMWQRLPAAQRADERSFAQAERAPLKYLSGKPTPQQKGARELLYYALERAARQDVEQARHAWLAIRDHWPQADREYGHLRLAYHAARHQHPDAHRFFNEAGQASLNETEQPWRIRAALWAGDYEAALMAIEALPAASRDNEMWRYWRARCLEQRRDEAAIRQAQTLYRQLAGQPTYYGLLAHERLASAAVPPWTVPSAPAWPDAGRDFLKRGAVQRIIKLQALDLRTEMLDEWRALARTLNDAELRVAAIAMAQQGMFDRSIAAAERMTASIEWSLRYPRPFPEAFQRAGATHGVDENWLYAVARQESRFVPDIVSSAGAIGLMQLMPRTARWVATQRGMNDYRIEYLNDAAVNADFGAFYLRHCLDGLNGSLVLAAAAYNAGPGRARAWRARAAARGGAAMEGDIWIESIPFDETRDYIKKVLANARMYAQQRQQTFSLREALAAIHSPPTRATAGGRGFVDADIDDLPADRAITEKDAP
ncbi:MAG: lytic transglycosylase domain-containing protein [Proteobacteria bacterium]|nr:lytic transglycosylase domain-containing protein [Pseudomonadota bacterium]MCL2307958.1 lytic transglycosylase domain-containing protein [Pseudomonadota bacterium]